MGIMSFIRSVISVVPAALAVIVLAVGLREVAARSATSVGTAPTGRFSSSFYRFLAVMGLFTLGNSADAFLVLRAQDLGLNVTDPREQRRLDGSLPENTSFDGWLQRQPESVQRDILGARRWALWKQGVELEQFSDSRRVLNLGELESRGIG